MAFKVKDRVRLLRDWTKETPDVFGEEYPRAGAVGVVKGVLEQDGLLRVAFSGFPGVWPGDATDFEIADTEPAPVASEPAAIDLQAEIAALKAMVATMEEIIKAKDDYIAARLAELEAVRSERQALAAALAESQRTTRALRVVNALKVKMHYYEMRRGSNFGIACDTDDYAIRWQTLDKRLAVVEDALAAVGKAAEGGE